MSAAAVVAAAAGGAVLLLGAACRPAPPRAPLPPRPPLGSAGRARRGTAGSGLDHSIALLDHLCREVRAGASYTAALVDGLDQHPAVLAGLRAALLRGAPMGDALARLAERSTAPLDATDVLVVQALRAAHAAGGSRVDALERAAGVLRERRAWQHERRAQSAQARLSARVLTLLPVAFAAWGIAADSRLRAAYAESPLPGVCTACGLLLDLAGWWWMRRLVRGAG
jgi:tight adherence protein B